MTELIDLQKVKTETLKLMVHNDTTNLEGMERKFFQSLFVCKDWSMQKLDKDGVRYVQLNSQIITLKTFDGDDLIQSNQYTSATGTKDSFSMTLYFAHLGGKWVLIW